jgi:hypothetical protein
MGESGRIGKPSNLHRSSTSDTFFRVPPLTLQPIVENAVKHGRDPLHISIREQAAALNTFWKCLTLLQLLSQAGANPALVVVEGLGHDSMHLAILTFAHAALRPILNASIPLRIPDLRRLTIHGYYLLNCDGYFFAIQ